MVSYSIVELGNYSDTNEIHIIMIFIHMLFLLHKCGCYVTFLLNYGH